MSGTIKTSDVARLLEQWGIWAWTGVPRLEAKSMTLQIIQDNIELKRRRAFAMITDEQAEQIDSAVSALKRCQPLTWEAVTSFYLLRMDGIDIAQAMGGSQKLALARIDQGIMWIEGRLSGIEDVRKTA